MYVNCTCIVSLLFMADLPPRVYSDNEPATRAIGGEPSVLEALVDQVSDDCPMGKRYKSFVVRVLPMQSPIECARGEPASSPGIVSLYAVEHPTPIAVASIHDAHYPIHFRGPHS